MFKKQKASLLKMIVVSMIIHGASLAHSTNLSYIDAYTSFDFSSEEENRKLCLGLDLGVTCTDWFNLHEFLTRLDRQKYKSDEEKTHQLAQVLSQGNSYFGVEYGSSLFQKLSELAEAKEGGLKNFVFNGKDSVIDDIDDQIRDSEFISILLDSLTNEVIKKYSQINQYISAEKENLTEMVFNDDEADEVVKNIRSAEAARQKLKNELKVYVEDMGLNFTDQTIGRLVSSPVGHQEIKMMIVSATLRDLVKNMGEKLSDLKPTIKNEQEALKSSIQAQQYLGLYAFFIRSLVVTMDMYADKIDTEFIPTVLETKESSENIINNNQVISEKSKKLNDQVIRVSNLYVDKLQTRSQELRDNEKRTFLTEKFKELSIEYATVTNVSELIDVINTSEEINTNLEDLINSDLVFFDNSDEATSLSQQALSLIEEKLF